MYPVHRHFGKWRSLWELLGQDFQGTVVTMLQCLSSNHPFSFTIKEFQVWEWVLDWNLGKRPLITILVTCTASIRHRLWSNSLLIGCSSILLLEISWSTGHFHRSLQLITPISVLHFSVYCLLSTSYLWQFHMWPPGFRSPEYHYPSSLVYKSNYYRTL